MMGASIADGTKHYQEIISGAHRAETDAAEAADGIRAEARKKEDAKGAVEAGRVAKGHRQRRLRAGAFADVVHLPQPAADYLTVRLGRHRQKRLVAQVPE